MILAFLSLIVQTFSPVYAVTVPIRNENPLDVSSIQSADTDSSMQSMLHLMIYDSMDVANDLYDSNYSDASASYKGFHNSFMYYMTLTNNFDVNSSDYSAVISDGQSLDWMLSKTVDYSIKYHNDYDTYSRLLAEGNKVDATTYALKLRESYTNISNVNGGFDKNLYSLKDHLNDSSIDTNMLNNSIEKLNLYLTQLSQTQHDVDLMLYNSNFTLSASKSEVGIGESVDFAATYLTDNPIPANTTVLFRFNGQPYGSAVLDDSGIAHFTYTLPLSSPAYLSADAIIIPGDQSIAPAISNVTTVKVKTEDTTLTSTMTPDVATFGDTVTVSGSMTSSNGTNLSGKGVHILLTENNASPAPSETSAGAVSNGTTSAGAVSNGTTSAGAVSNGTTSAGITINETDLGTVNVDDNGAYTFQFPITQDMQAGGYTLWASFKPATGSSFLNSSVSENHALTISPTNTLTTLNLSGNRFTGGDGITLSGNVQTEKGSAVAGASVVLYAGDEELDTVQTDLSGNYEYTTTVPYDLPLGTNQIKAVYTPPAGNLYGSQSSPAEVTISPQTMVITADSPAQILFVGDTIDLTGKVATTNGRPVANYTLKATLGDQVIDTPVTDEHGQYSISRGVSQNDPLGTRTLIISSNDNKQTSPAPIEAGTILIIPYDKSSIRFLVLLGIVVILAIIIRRSGLDRMLIMSIRHLLSPSARIEQPTEQPAEEPVAAEPIQEKVFDPEAELAMIKEMAESGDMSRAVTSIYTLSRYAARTTVSELPDSMTHLEFFKFVLQSRPGTHDALKPIVTLYEVVAYGHRQVNKRDLEMAMAGFVNLCRELSRPVEVIRL
ncbi:MAG TPA: hypothetical protein VK436_11100 [Methanocella sp.]|nr:hypothetical protein [Methanocella sp.]